MRGNYWGGCDRCLASRSSGSWDWGYCNDSCVEASGLRGHYWRCSVWAVFDGWCAGRDGIGKSCVDCGNCWVWGDCANCFGW